MKFTSLLKDILLEQSRFEILRTALTKPTEDKNGKKQKAKMSMEEFLKLVQADPTTKLNNVDPESANSKELEKIKAGKYVNWLIKSYLNPKTERQPGDTGYEREVAQAKETFLEDLYKVTDDLKKFTRFKGRIEGERDIMKMTPDQLYDAVKDFDLTLATTTKAERKSAPVHPGAELMYDGEDWRVIKIEDKGASGKEAACFYGGNNKETRWCTSAPGLSWFDRYIKDGPLYVVFNPNDPKTASETGLPVERFQFHFPSNQFMDKDDRQQDLVGLLNGRMAELKPLFKPEFAKGLTVGGEKLVIDSFSHGAIGKFIALYGLDDLIESLPPSLKEFQIQNRDNNNQILVKIPESIGNFQELRMILLDNCVDSVPETICSLPKLKFLALINNQKLTSIPECIGELPNLFFLNLKGSTNVEVPESVKRRGTDMGNGMWDLEEE
jgi:molecular chaperone GrpE (heat shock protein)